MLEEGEDEAEQGGAAEERGKEPDGAFEKREETGGEGGQQANEESGEHCGEGAGDSSEELDGEPEKGEAEEEAGLMETYGHAQTA
jgi:hypothetical protein